MAWRNYNNDSDDGKVSEWNSAALKMKRLNNKMELLNDINGNLRAFNSDWGIYNYELHFRTCKALYAEVDSKLTPEEKGEGRKMIINIQVILEKYPITQAIKARYKKNLFKRNEIYLKVLEGQLYEFELMVREFIDTHGMDTSYGEDDEGL